MKIVIGWLLNALGVAALIVILAASALWLRTNQSPISVEWGLRQSGAGKHDGGLIWAGNGIIALIQFHGFYSQTVRPGDWGLHPTLGMELPVTEDFATSQSWSDAGIMKASGVVLLICVAA